MDAPLEHGRLSTHLPYVVRIKRLRSWSVPHAQGGELLRNEPNSILWDYAPDRRSMSQGGARKKQIRQIKANILF